jgi:hypothetical protein
MLVGHGGKTGGPIGPILGRVFTLTAVVLLVDLAGCAAEDDTATVDVSSTTERVTTTRRSTTTTRPTTTTTTQPTTTTTRPTTTTTAPPPPPPPPTTAAPAPPGNCHPSYDPCVPYASDVDCAGGSGNGPAYTGRVNVIGPDVYDLDRDGDGVACE